MARRLTKLRTVAVDVDERRAAGRSALPWPWWAGAAGGAVVVLAAGWLLLAGALALGSLAAPHPDLAAALGLASSLLLLAHGAPVTIGGQAVTLVPLTLTLLLTVAGASVTSMAARQLAGRRAEDDDTGRLFVDGQSLVLRVTAAYAGTYVVAVLLLGSAVAGPGAWRAVPGALAVALVTGLWGASRAIGHDPRRGWPDWLRAAPTALAAAVLVCVAGGAVVVAAALVAGMDNVAGITEQLGPDAIGVFLLVLLQLLYLPNLVLWGTGWALGAGVTLGDGSVLNLNVADAGFLPAIPVLGAVPHQGLTPPGTLWWLLVGVAGGALVALLVVVSRGRERFDRTALAGALSGVAAGLALTLVCSLSGGGLGAGRLVHLGPRVGDLVVVAPSLLGLAGLVTGLVTGLVRRPPVDQ